MRPPHQDPPGTAFCAGCGKPIKGSVDTYTGEQWHGRCYEERRKTEDAPTVLEDASG